jgi:hypothetical protein
MRVTEDRSTLRVDGEVYVQQWADDDDNDDAFSLPAINILLIKKNI